MSDIPTIIVICIAMVYGWFRSKRDVDLHRENAALKAELLATKRESDFFRVSYLKEKDERLAAEVELARLEGVTMHSGWQGKHN